MRLWSLHPQYLDSRGLVALWREGLLARHVLLGLTSGYRHHPQLERFKAQAEPVSVLDQYLSIVSIEAAARGYQFDREKITFSNLITTSISLTEGQLAYEWQHLLAKLRYRSPACHQKWSAIVQPVPHPLFTMIPGPAAPWEKIHTSS